MKYLVLVGLAVFVLVSCAQINRDSRDKYQAEHQPKLKHGIVVLKDGSVDQDAKVGSLQKNLDQASVARGKALYNKHCISCHGDKGLGDGADAGKQDNPPANLQKLAKEVANFKFFMSISQWQGEMPGWKEPFNESDREDLVSYIKTFRMYH